MASTKMKTNFIVDLNNLTDKAQAKYSQDPTPNHTHCCHLEPTLNNTTYPCMYVCTYENQGWFGWNKYTLPLVIYLGFSPTDLQFYGKKHFALFQVILKKRLIHEDGGTASIFVQDYCPVELTSDCRLEKKKFRSEVQRFNHCTTEVLEITADDWHWKTKVRWFRSFGDIKTRALFCRSLHVWRGTGGYFLRYPVFSFRWSLVSLLFSCVQLLCLV